MNKRQKDRLVSTYTKYHAKKKDKNALLRFLRSFMPEIVFRTTKLEGERVTRKMISSLFK